MAIARTQSLAHKVGECWRRPELLVLELAWRWGFGVPASLLLIYEAVRIAGSVPLRQTGIFDLSPQLPMRAAQSAAAAWAMLAPPILRTAMWLGPLLAIGWAAASGIGRTVLLRRMDHRMRAAPGTLIVLQLLRITGLAALVIGWWLAIHWVAAVTLGGREPSLASYLFLLIAFSLAAFTLWTVVSWVFSIAPLFAMIESAGVAQSLLRSLRLGPMTGKLVEVNMVLGIAKLGLAAFATMLSLFPLPFSASVTGFHLYLWWIVITLAYMVAADFLQVVKLSAFAALWRN